MALKIKSISGIEDIVVSFADSANNVPATGIVGLETSGNIEKVIEDDKVILVGQNYVGKGVITINGNEISANLNDYYNVDKVNDFLDEKQDLLLFGYDENSAISAINGSAIAQPEVDLSEYYKKTETSGKEELSAEFDTKQNIINNKKDSSIPYLETSGSEPSWEVIESSQINAYGTAEEGELYDIPINGRTYKVVCINGKLWLAENYVNEAKATYTHPKYGSYFNKAAINNANFVPQGWHIPSKEEWQGLIDYTENHEKYLSTTDWHQGTNYATGTNELKLNILPGSEYNIGRQEISSEYYQARFWTTTDEILAQSTSKQRVYVKISNYIGYNNKIISFDWDGPDSLYYFPVRLIKDDLDVSGPDCWKKFNGKDFMAIADNEGNTFKDFYLKISAAQQLYQPKGDYASSADVTVLNTYYGLTTTGWKDISTNYYDKQTVDNMLASISGNDYSAGSMIQIEDNVINIKNDNCSAIGDYAIAVGYETSAIGDFSFTEGQNTYAGGLCDHVEGMGGNGGYGGLNHIEGFQYHAYGSNGVSEFFNTNKIKIKNTRQFNGYLYDLVKTFKEKFVVSCEYRDSTEYHYTGSNFYKPVIYKIVEVELDTSTDDLVITLNDYITKGQYGSVLLLGPTTISSITGSGGSLTSNQTINQFTLSSLGFPGNNLESIRIDNTFISISYYYAPIGSSTQLQFYKNLSLSNIEYDDAQHKYVFTLSENIEIPEINGGGYSYSVYVMNIPYYGCNHIEGQDNKVENCSNIHIEGYKNLVRGTMAHAEGNETSAISTCCHSEGKHTLASNNYTHAEGEYTTAEGLVTHSEGSHTNAFGNYTHAEGYYTTAAGNYSHAEGYYTSAAGAYSHAEGGHTSAYKSYAHSEGKNTLASGDWSHAEGNSTTAAGYNTHAEGNCTYAKEQCSHAEGNYASAIGVGSHAESNHTSAVGSNSHAEGDNTSAIAYDSHAGGSYTIANYNYETVIGKYNLIERNDDPLFVVGNGTASNRSDAFVVTDNGTASAVNFISNNVSLSSLTGDYVEHSELTCKIGTNNTATTTGTFVQGTNNIIISNCQDTLVQGEGNIAGYRCFAQGENNKAGVGGQHDALAQGYSNTAGNYSLAQGNLCSAVATAFAQGNRCSAYNYSFAQGNQCYAYDGASFAQGQFASATNWGVAFGEHTSATNNSFVLGSYSNSINWSMAAGQRVSAYQTSFAQGQSVSASNYSLAQGSNCIATGYSIAQGYNCQASSYSIAQGDDCKANFKSFAQGDSNSATNWSMCIGIGNSASDYSFAGGSANTAKNYNFTYGRNNYLDNNGYSIVVGTSNTASGSSNCLVAGVNNFYSGGNSAGCFIAGANNFAKNDCAVAIGSANSVYNTNAIAIGVSNIASADGSIAIGSGVKATQRGQIVLGRYNASSTDASDLLVVGNGQGSNYQPTNAMVVKTDGLVSAVNLKTSAGQVMIEPSLTAGKQYSYTTTGWHEFTLPEVPTISAENGITATTGTGADAGKIIVGIDTTNYKLLTTTEYNDLTAAVQIVATNSAKWVLTN